MSAPVEPRLSRSRQWLCGRCREVHRGHVVSTLDPRWAFARCSECHKQVIVTRRDAGAGEGAS